MVGVVAFVVVLGLLILVHELGHFISAKAFGVKVDEFGFGYPPRLLKLGTWRGTAVTLNMLPFGGFVNMAENDPTAVGGLASKGRGVRALVFVGGALMNVLLALVLFSVIFMAGAPTPVEAPGAGIYAVSAGSPAEQAGLLPGDNIISIDGQPIQDAAEAMRLIKAKLGEPLTLGVQRDGRDLAPKTVTPRVSPPPGEGAVGVALDLPLMRQAYPLWQAVPLGARATFNVAVNLFTGIRDMLRQRVAVQISGPVGIYDMTRQVAKSGLMRLIEFTGVLSVNLAIFQLLPLPALDGGRLFFILLELVRGGRKIAPEKEGWVHAVGLIMLVGLMFVVTFFDVQRLVK